MRFTPSELIDMAYRYQDDGDTFEAIALDVGISTHSLRRYLRPLVIPRGRGLRPGQSPANRADARAALSGPAVHVAGGRQRYTGHRRRGGW